MKKDLNIWASSPAQEVPSSIFKEEKRHYVDAGFDINSPFLPLLRKERDIDILLSLDFSMTDPFEVILGFFLINQNGVY